MLNGGAMTVKEACEYLRISPATFYRWIAEGRIPPGKKLSKRSVRWLRSTIEAVMNDGEEKEGE